MSAIQQPATLKRSISLAALVLYGMGTILGAGIYVLVAEVTAQAGLLSPLAFLAATVIVAFSAYSFATLSKRFPVSAGEAAYVQEAFHRDWLSTAVGYAVIFVGITSSATIARGFCGYLGLFVAVPTWLALTAFITLLTAIAIRGVGISVRLAVAATIVEIAGLVLVIISAADKLPTALDNLGSYFLPDQIGDWRGIGLGAYLAFYACIGFEDMVNMAEEAENPQRNLPLAIALVLLLTTLLYVLVTLSALVSVPLAELRESSAPLALVMEKNGLVPVAAMGIVSAVAITNGALIQIIMGSRVLYGMAQRNLAPPILGRINPATRTPGPATLLIGGAVLLLALLFPLQKLAVATSTIVLCVFTLVNLSLLALECRGGKHSFARIGIPLAGAILSLLFIAVQLIA